MNNQDRLKPRASALYSMSAPLAATNDSASTAT